ncbi:conserved hypothetical protein [Candidatus Magnetomoraceae bacterium gMMP-15]
MKWSQIRTQYPDQFILLKNYHTEPVDENHFRVTEGEVITIDTDFRKIQKQYKHFRTKGMDVIFCLPQTKDFIVETSPMMGFLDAIYRT